MSDTFSTVDVNQIKKLVNNEYSGKLLYVTISGAHLYGFESKDSDIDYRGCWLIDTNKLLGITSPRDYIRREQGLKDIVLYELKKELKLLNEGNCNVLEHLYAKQLYTTDEYFSIKKIISLNLNIIGIYKSYRGMAWKNYNKFCLKGVHTVKKFLYVFRAILAGIYALQNRGIQPNLANLLQEKENEYYYNPINRLIRLKKEGNENDFLADRQLPEYHKLVEQMITEIDKVYEEVQPSEKLHNELNKAREFELDRFLKKTRKYYLKKNEGDN